MTEDKRCGTCKWYRGGSFEGGRCEYPIPIVLSFALTRTDAIWNDTKPFRDWGCPTWQPKEPSNDRT